MLLVITMFKQLCGLLVSSELVTADEIKRSEINIIIQVLVLSLWVFLLLILLDQLTLSAVSAGACAWSSAISSSFEVYSPNMGVVYKYNLFYTKKISWDWEIPNIYCFPWICPHCYCTIMDAVRTGVWYASFFLVWHPYLIILLAANYRCFQIWSEILLKWE
jgi:hypothetical protein